MRILALLLLIARPALDKHSVVGVMVVVLQETSLLQPTEIAITTPTTVARFHVEDSITASIVHQAQLVAIVSMMAQPVVSTRHLRRLRIVMNGQTQMDAQETWTVPTPLAALVVLETTIIVFGVFLQMVEETVGDVTTRELTSLEKVIVEEDVISNLWDFQQELRLELPSPF